MKENKITVETLLSWNPCYSSDGEKYCEAELVKKLGDGKTPIEVSRMWSIPANDRIWVLLRPEVLGEDNLKSVLDEIVDYHVERSCLDCGIPEVEKWAKGWLGGEDRTEESAYLAKWAARAAYLAAESSRSAQAAAWSAWAAYSAAESSRSAQAAARAAYSAARSATDVVARAGAAEAAVAEEEKRQLGIIRKYLRSD